MKGDGAAIQEFRRWCKDRCLEFENDKIGRAAARQSFKVWYLMRAECSQKIGVVRRELEWTLKDIM